MASEKTAKAPKKKTGKAGKNDKTTLVIVESPAKAKTIEKYLGSRYVVLASMGHLIDLPKSRIGVDVEHDFTPEYLTIRGKAKLLKELQKYAKKAETVLLASDNDREGEAIAYHIRNSLALKNPGLEIKRIVFNEITPQAIRDAVKAPGVLDEDKVNAQKARRVLDRLVGYNLSPVLWKKVKNGLSAGRVQSVALRLICDREKEVESFIPEEYWTLEADFKKGRYSFSGQLVSFKGGKAELGKEAEVLAVMKAITSLPCVIADIRESERTVNPKPPFTTSKLQQTSANRLGFTSKKTMQIAQQLYEGINIGSTRIGLITYMRTDSVRVSDVALKEVREYLGTHYPAELPAEPVIYATDKKAQDAHEAIRPTTLAYSPDTIKEYLNKDQQKLYGIIWERFLASQMTAAKQRSLAIDVAAGEAIFRINSSRLVEKGFYKVIKLLATKEDKETALPELHPGDELKLEGYRPEQHFTQGPARYTDASIIRILEEKGIGRPSTYAPIISVLLERYYVTRENRQLVPTTLGRMINEILVESFPTVVDAGFTAGMESMLDEVEENKRDWVLALKDFYGPFKARIDEVMENLQSYRGSLDEATDVVCEKCGKPMVKKLGRFGFFLACTGFPECRNTRSIPLARCPRDGCTGEIVARRKAKGRGREFYGCSRYPECDFITYYKPTNSYCPKCGWFLVERFDKKRGSYKACINPACDYLHSQEDEHVTIN
ncbi:MAG: DNA topoisomerase I [Spirochaetes bacterium RIFOXYC1_FULL_54_7]|nr:MAG: DNA topoisomerase I [Spirochaetes bacterium RIFOXYC1_FULL_54_7]